jgi:hypothetical protein
MLNSVLNTFFGCSHRRTTFPITPKRPAGRIGAYVTCLECGKEFSYNWDEMRMEEHPAASPLEPPPEHPVNRPMQGLSRLLRLGN